MAEGAAPGNVVLLLDNYSLLSRRLHESIQKVESEILVIVITEDNFLPDNVMSIYWELHRWRNQKNDKTQIFQ